MAARGKWIIKLDQIPANIVVHDYIYQNTDLKEQIELFKNHKRDDYVESPVHFEMSALENSVKSGIKLFGQHHFVYKDQQKELKSYVSCSLTFNPDAIDKISLDPHLATLGSTMLQFGSASEYQNGTTDRNTYNDTYSFKTRTPLADHQSIKTFLDSFKRTLIRSRVSTVLAGMEEATKADYCWHNDENIFINLRVNVPIQTSPNYVIQVIADASGEHLDIVEFELKKQFAYAYNTSKYHRPFCKKLDTVDRINMICGVSPWFDFDELLNAWVSNEFYGEMHPFDMLRNGHISSLIKT